MAISLIYDMPPSGRTALPMKAAFLSRWECMANVIMLSCLLESGSEYSYFAESLLRKKCKNTGFP